MKRTDDDVYLPAFYTHSQGYKMFAIPIGNGTGKGTHISIFTFLMKSLYNKHLKWPFKGNITIQIVNQAGDHDHVEKIITYDEKIPDASRVVSGCWSDGWGESQFLAHNTMLLRRPST